MAGVRPDGSKSAISELWLDGEMVSRAELTRSRMNHSAEKDLKQAVKEQSQAGFDAGHWYWQPVGGRMVRRTQLGRRDVALSGLSRRAREQRVRRVHKAWRRRVPQVAAEGGGLR